MGNVRVNRLTSEDQRQRTLLNRPAALSETYRMRGIRVRNALAERVDSVD